MADSPLHVSTPAQLLHTQVRDRIVADLATTCQKPGERYYTEDELCRRFGVSRNTVRRAMADLEERGYLQRKRGLGSVIRRLPGQDPGETASVPAAKPASSPSSGVPSVSPHRRLLVVLPEWDDSTEGFYAARVLRELTCTAPPDGWHIEIRHPGDEMAVTASESLAWLAIDPQHTMIHRLHLLAAAGARVLVLAPSHPLPFALMLCDETRQAAMQAVQRFHALGHHAIGIVVHELTHRDHHEALTGFIAAHRALNLPVAPQAIVQVFKSPGQSRPRLMPGHGITAWLTTFSAGVSILASACHEQGLRIPEDVAIVGMDDLGESPVPFTDCRLTVVRPDPAAAAEAVWSSLGRWHPGLPGQTIALPMTWIDRQSVAPRA